MERNDGNNLGANPGEGDAKEFTGGSTQPTDAGFDFNGPGLADQGQSIRDRAKNVASSAGGRLADVGSGIRDKAGSARDKLVGALEAGADRLRDRSQANALSGADLAGAQLAGEAAAGTTSITADGKVAHVSDRVAGGLQASADWLRDADIDGLKTGIERQVKDHPGRTLLVAAGLGYLIGRAFRNKE